MRNTKKIFKYFILFFLILSFTFTIKAEQFNTLVDKLDAEWYVPNSIRNLSSSEISIIGENSYISSAGTGSKAVISVNPPTFPEEYDYGNYMGNGTYGHPYILSGIVFLNLNGGNSPNVNSNGWSSSEYCSHDDMCKPIKENMKYSFPSVVKSGYEFDGWYYTVGDIKVSSNTNVEVSYSHVIYANWIPIGTFVLTLDAQGGVLSENKIDINFKSTSYGELPTPTRVGYQFMGWYTESGGNGTLVTADSPLVIAQDHTLYAQWKRDAIFTYTGKFGVSSGTLADAKNNTYENTSFAPTGSNWQVYFLSSGTLTLTSDITVDIFLVGGGKSGGSGSIGTSVTAGAGGAGGTALTKTSYTISAGTYTITIGASGNATSFGTLLSAASGGGGAGGSAGRGCSGCTHSGGAGGSGTAAFTGEKFGGGGGGGATGSAGAHSAGSGKDGGGNGSNNWEIKGKAGTANTGGGGGGGAAYSSHGSSGGGTGGSGVIIMRNAR